VVLIIGTISILSEAIPRLFQPEIPHVPGILFFAMAGIGANSIAARTALAQYPCRVMAPHRKGAGLGCRVGNYDCSIARRFPGTRSCAINPNHRLRSLQRFPSGAPNVSAFSSGSSRRDRPRRAAASTRHANPRTIKPSHSRLRAEVAQLCEEYGIAHTTVEIEWGETECRMAESVSSV